MRALFLGQGRIAAECLKLYGVDAEHGGSKSLVAFVVSKELADIVVALAQRSIVDKDVLIVRSEERAQDAILAVIRSRRVSHIISVQYPWILSQAVIEAVGGNAVNIHNARLPDYRGHNTLTHEILNGESSHTVTLHWIVPTVDRGHRCLEATIAVRSHETAESLYERSLPEAVKLFRRFVLEHEYLTKLARVPIEGEGAWYGRRSLETLKRIPDDASLQDIDRRARAFHFPPHEPAYFERSDGRRIHVVPAWIEEADDRAR